MEKDLIKLIRETVSNASDIAHMKDKLDENSKAVKDVGLAQTEIMSDMKTIAGSVKSIHKKLEDGDEACGHYHRKVEKLEKKQAIQEAKQNWILAGIAAIFGSGGVIVIFAKKIAVALGIVAL